MATRATNLLYISVSPSETCSRKPYVSPISSAKKISMILDSQVDDPFTKLTSIEEIEECIHYLTILYYQEIEITCTFKHFFQMEKICFQIYMYMYNIFLTTLTVYYRNS